MGAAHRLGLFYQLMHKVDTASIRHGGENVAAVRNLRGWVGVFRDLEASVFHRITLGMEKKAWALGT